MRQKTEKHTWKHDFKDKDKKTNKWDKNMLGLPSQRWPGSPKIQQLTNLAKLDVAL